MEKMVTITIIGKEPPCDKCKAAKGIAEKLLKKFPGQVELKVLDSLSEEAAKYGVIITPMVLVDRAVIAIGKVPEETKLEELVKRKLGL